MEKLSYTERLAKFLLTICIIVLVCVIASIFSGVVTILLISAVLALLAKPIMTFGKKLRIGEKSLPDWLLALVSIIIIALVICGAVSALVPVFKRLAGEIANISSGDSLSSISGYLANLNTLLRNTFKLDKNFQLEKLLFGQVRSFLDISLFGTMLGSVASTVAGIFFGIFSVVFISFFLIKDGDLVHRFILSLTPTRIEEKVSKAFCEVERLLTRYFAGLLLEMTCVAMIDFLGLWALAKLDFLTALGIGFMAGMMNIIPFVGPLIGGVLGGGTAIILQYCSAAAPSSYKFWVFVLIIAGVFISAKLVDDYFLQPMISSTCIQASPLEIFIVILIAGGIGGIVGMLLAIPGYTVVRVIAIQFFPDVKFIRMLHKKEPDKGSQEI